MRLFFALKFAKRRFRTLIRMKILTLEYTCMSFGGIAGNCFPNLYINFPRSSYLLTSLFHAVWQIPLQTYKLGLPKNCLELFSCFGRVWISSYYYFLQL